LWASLSNGQKERKAAGESARDAERFVRATVEGVFGHKDEWRKLASESPGERLSAEKRWLLQQAAEER
jgi:hypothetical protein